MKLSTFVRPINWQTLPHDFVRLECGLALLGAGIAILIQSGFGTSPWAVFEVGLTRLLPLSIGTVIMLDGVWVLATAIALKEKVGWGTVVNVLSVGPWTDLVKWLVPSIGGAVTELIWLRLLYFGLGLLGMGLGTALYISVQAGAGPRDSLTLALHRTFGWSVRRARSTMDIIVALIGILLSGPFGAGTILFALLFGPTLQLWFKLLRVPTHSAEPEISEP